MAFDEPDPFQQHPDWPIVPPRDPLLDLLTRLHDKGVLNEMGLTAVCRCLDAGDPLSREHLVLIFGVAEIYKLLTTRDETTVQLLREAYDAFTNRESVINLRDWIRTAEGIIGPPADAIASRD